MQDQTNLILRNDTILGVCEAIGQDFRFQPNWLRVAFCGGLFLNMAVSIGIYLALGVAVLVSRLLFRDSTAPGSDAVIDATARAASNSDEESMPIAA